MAGLLENMYRYATRPVRDLVELGNIYKTGMGVKRVEAPVFSREELLRFADNGGSKAFQASSGVKKFKKGIGESQKAYEKVTNYKPVALKQEEMEGLLDYDRALKNAAIAGSFMMPGIGSGLGGALATGAVAGGMGGYGGSRKGEELSSTLTGVGMGAALGGVGYGIGKGIERIKKPKVNEKLIKGSASKLNKSPEQFKNETNEIMTKMQKRGFDVSNKDKIANSYPKYLKEVQREAKSVADFAEGTPDLTDIRAIWKDFGEDIASSNSMAAKRLTRKTAELLDNPNPTYGDVIGYKQFLDEFGGGAENILKGGKVPIPAQAVLNLRNESRSIASGVRELDDVLREFSTGLTYKGTILKNPEITQMLHIPIAGNKINVRKAVDWARPTGRLQSLGQGPVGKVGGGASELLSPTGRFTPNLTGGLIGSSTYGGGMPSEGVAQGGEGMAPMGEGLPSQGPTGLDTGTQGGGLLGSAPYIDPETGFVTVPQGQSQQPKYDMERLQTDLIQAVSSGQMDIKQAEYILSQVQSMGSGQGGDFASQIEQLAQVDKREAANMLAKAVMNGQVDTTTANTITRLYGLSAPSQTATATLDTADIIANQAEEMLGEITLFENELVAAGTGIFRNLYASRVPGSKEGEYHKWIKGTRTKIARALGEVGNLSEPEQIAAEQLMPTLGDTPTSAKNKIAIFRNLIDISRRRLRGEYVPDMAEEVRKAAKENTSLNIPSQYEDYDSWQY